MDDDFSVGAIRISDESPTRFVAWNKEFLGWYDLNGQLITIQDNDNVKSIAFLNDLGLVRAIDSEIIITNYSGEVIAEDEEGEARFIS